jgi:dTDP-4-dehydrorhamnose 3,5-epimerase-like enzyme
MNIEKIKPIFVDERGSIWDFLTGEIIHHVGFLITVKGAIRGKHFHKEQKQYTLITKGKMKIIVKDLKNPNSRIEEFELESNDMIMFPSFYYHSIEAMEDSECLVFTSKSRSGDGYEDDTYRIDDIDSFELNITSSKD